MNSTHVFWSIAEMFKSASSGGNSHQSNTIHRRKMKYLPVLMSIVAGCCALSPPVNETPVLRDLIAAMRGKSQLSKITALLEELNASGELDQDFYGKKILFFNSN